MTHLCVIVLLRRRDSQAAPETHLHPRSPWNKTPADSAWPLILSHENKGLFNGQNTFSTVSSVWRRPALNLLKNGKVCKEDKLISHSLQRQRAGAASTLSKTMLNCGPGPCTGFWMCFSQNVLNLCRKYWNRQPVNYFSWWWCVCIDFPFLELLSLGLGLQLSKKLHCSTFFKSQPVGINWKSSFRTYEGKKITLSITSSLSILTFIVHQTWRVRAIARTVHTGSTQIHLINIPDKTKPHSAHLIFLLSPKINLCHCPLSRTKKLFTPTHFANKVLHQDWQMPKLSAAATAC